jgi:hypothetical protein
MLGMLFYRFISENLTAYINKEEQRLSKNAPLSIFGFFKDTEEVSQFITGLDKLKEK